MRKAAAFLRQRMFQILCDLLALGVTYVLFAVAKVLITHLADWGIP